MSHAHAVSTQRLVAEPEVGARQEAQAESALRAGVWLGIAAITMLFLAFTSAYIVRYGLDPQWQALRMPWLLRPNTALLLVSSVCLEVARGARNPRPLLLGTFGGGLLFVAGQLVIWRQLAGFGLTFAANAHASFFYTFTAVHGLHLAGGIIALAWLSTARVVNHRWLDAVAVYWHFMGALWLYLAFLLFGVR